MQIDGLHIEVSLLSLGCVAGMAAIVAARAVTPKSWHLVVSTVMSAALIGLGSWPTLAMLGGITLCVVYPLSRLIARSRESAPRRARALLALGIATVVCAWVAFKLNKEMELPFIEGTSVGAELLRLVGFSYFIFRGVNVLYMHYLIGDVPDAGPMSTLFFAIFPATITSGPIQKYPDFCRQSASLAPLDVPTVAVAVERITLGYFYKVCITPVLQSQTDSMLASGRFNVLQSVAFTAMLYVFVFFDFAGYSHIAVGFGALLGVRVPENFRRPFLATSVTEFWRNWHISIGDWFRDHVFIPLGGMRLGGLRAAFLAAAIMLACGMWHGFTLMFLAWGAWHASMLFLEGVTGAKPMPPGDRHGPRYWSRIVSTNARIAFGALFFLPTFGAARPVMEGFLRWW